MTKLHRNHLQKNGAARQRRKILPPFAGLFLCRVGSLLHCAVGRIGASGNSGVASKSPADLPPGGNQPVFQRENVHGAAGLGGVGGFYEHGVFIHVGGQNIGYGPRRVGIFS